MENLSRNLEKDITTYTLPSQAKRQNHWKLLFIGDDGRVFRIFWFKTAIVTLIVLYCMGICGSGLFYYLYRASDKKYTASQLALKQIKQQLKIYQSDHMPTQTPLIAETEINTSPKNQKIANPPSSIPPKGPSENTGIIRTEAPVKKEGQSKEQPDHGPATSKTFQNEPVVKNSSPNNQVSTETKVDISDLVVSQRLKQKRVRFKFVVRNESQINQSISGYIFLILKYKAATENQWITIPTVSLVSGKPVQVDQGQYFKISNYKTVTFKIAQNANLSQYDEATIIIYDEETKHLIFEKHYPIAIKSPDKPRNDPLATQNEGNHHSSGNNTPSINNKLPVGQEYLKTDQPVEGATPQHASPEPTVRSASPKTLERPNPPDHLVPDHATY